MFRPFTANLRDLCLLVFPRRRDVLRCPIAERSRPGLHYSAASRFGSCQFQLAILVAGLVAFGATSLRAAASNASQNSIDTARSAITMRVYKAGVFSAFGHEHEVRAPIRNGSIDEEKRTVEFVVDAGALRVMDRDVSDKDRSEIQSTMLGPKVLDSERFPTISFRSITIEQAGAGKWTVRGELTLHGQTHTVTATVEGKSGHYRGSAPLRQRDFGITPVSVAGGSIKVKDELRVEFEIFANGEGK